MAEKAPDRRVQKTLQHLQDALRELLQEKEYDEVTVQEVLDRANVGRSTFYAHFENKEQLVQSLLADLRIRYEKSATADGLSRLGTRDRLQTPQEILRIVDRNRRLFQAMLARHGDASRRGPFQEYFFDLTREHLKSLLRSGNRRRAETDLVSHSYAGAIVGALEWWLTNEGSYSVEELAALLDRMITPGLLGFIDD